MAAKLITKKHKNKKGQVVETTYRVDADFIPTTINDIVNEFMENYCVANNEMAWFLEKLNTTSYEVKRKDKETGNTVIEIVKCKNYPFVNLRRDFTQKFFPAILKGEQADKEETFKERMNRLYGKK